MIETHDLTKIFKKNLEVRLSWRERMKNYVLRKRDTIVAVNKVSLKIKKGEIFGIVGPNGAGKTTLVKLLSTLILPDWGTAKIDGHDLVAEEKTVRSKIGVMTGEHSRSLYWRLTGKQNLEFFARLYDIKNSTEKINELLDFMGLKKVQNELVMKYSGGMQHKLTLARALLNDPPILLLDEPTTGIDAKARYEIKQFIKALRDKTILWTSHNLYEIEEICSRMAMIDHGKILFEGKPDDLKKHYFDYKKLEIVLNSPSANLFSSIENVNIEDNYTVEIVFSDINKTLRDISEIIEKDKVSIKSLTTISPSLEEVFIKALSKNDKNASEGLEK